MISLFHKVGGLLEQSPGAFLGDAVLAKNAMSVMTKERSLIATNVKESFKNFSHTSKMSRTLTTSGKESCNDNLPRCHRLPQQAERRPTMTNLTRLKMKGKGSHETRPEMKGKESHETGRWEC